MNPLIAERMARAGHEEIEVARMPPNGLAPIRHGRRIHLPSKHPEDALKYLLSKNVQRPMDPEDNKDLLRWAENAAMLVSLLMISVIFGGLFLIFWLRT